MAGGSLTHGSREMTRDDAEVSEMVGGRLVADGSVAEHRLCDLSHVDPTDETEAPLVLFADRCRSE